MERRIGRLEAFSDGVFGVAITLLAIEIGITLYPDATNINLWHKILEHWPEYFTYFNSFATILLIWIGHHKIIDRLRFTSHRLFMLNGLVLLFVALFPYPTRMVGTFIGTEAQDTAVAFYAGFTGVINLSLLLLNIVIIRSPHLLMNPSQGLPWFKAMIKRQLVGITAYTVAAALAFYSSTIALIITFLMWVFWALATKDEKEGE